LCTGDSTGNERRNTSGQSGFEEVTTFVDHSFKTSSSEDEEDAPKEQERKPNPRLQKQSKKTISD
jgi:hypothetical protein